MHLVRARIDDLRAGFRVSELFAPRLGARVRDPPLVHRSAATRVRPMPDGGGPFTVTAQHAEVRGFSFGSGPVIYLMHGGVGWARNSARSSIPCGPTAFGWCLRRAGPRRLSSWAVRPRPYSCPRVRSGVGRGAARFGPADTVIAHSMGAVPALLAQVHGWMSTQRLVFLAPMRDLATHFDRFAGQVGIGPRVRRAMTSRTERLVGYPVAGIDIGVPGRPCRPGSPARGARSPRPGDVCTTTRSASSRTGRGRRG